MLNNKKEEIKERIKTGKKVLKSGITVAVGRKLTSEDVELLMKASEIQEKEGGKLEIAFF